jgi:hypothetical protein
MFCRKMKSWDKRSTYRGSLRSEIGYVQPNRCSSSSNWNWYYRARSNLSNLLQLDIEMHCSSVSRARNTRAPKHERLCFGNWCWPLKNNKWDVEQVKCLSPKSKISVLDEVELWQGWCYVRGFCRPSCMNFTSCGREAFFYFFIFSFLGISSMPMQSIYFTLLSSV